MYKLVQFSVDGLWTPVQRSSSKLQTRGLVVCGGMCGRLAEERRGQSGARHEERQVAETHVGLAVTCRRLTFLPAEVLLWRVGCDALTSRERRQPCPCLR